MTFNPEFITDYAQPLVAEPVMAIVDEFGIETPITEVDIQQTLESMTDEKPETYNLQVLSQLMECADAARAVV